MCRLCSVIEEIQSQEILLGESSSSEVISLIKNAKHIFLAGAGRSGLMISAFANRLMHLGFDTNVIGEISTPHSQSGDLLIIGSGSGETVRLVNQAKIAKNNGVKLVLVTQSAQSTLANMADYVVDLSNNISSMQPMGSLFEQTSLIYYDSLVLDLMANLGETSQTMKVRHADIE